MKARLVLLLACVLALALLTGCAKSATYPAKPVELVCSWSAGGGSDRFARAVAEEIKNRQLLAQPVVVTNKPGSNGITGASYVAAKKGDSYTLLTNVTGDVGAWVASATSRLSPANFTPIAMIAWDEYILMVKADSPFTTLRDLVEFSKANPGKITFGGAGVGTVDHMATNQLVAKSGAVIEYVPFEGGGEILSSILGGHITATWANPAEAASQMKAGKLRALAVAAPKRLEKLPAIPTVRELGYDVVFQQYRGIVGPAGMPEADVKILAGVLKQVAESPEFKANYIDRNSLTLEYKGPQELAKIIAETEKTAREILKK